MQVADDGSLIGKPAYRPLRAPYHQVRLTQFQNELLPWLLPHDQRKSYAFWTYDIHSDTIGLVTAMVIPKKDGSSITRLRPTQRRAFIEYHFDAENNLQRIVLPSGRSLLPTSPRQLQRIWKDREAS